ncbi:glycosyltransferase [uncultured Polaribacter sp.]|uniref:glycosyltransferase n=1 Tax=uncultured Polaribacter sp. TaxID=174711 RepID=UPI00261E1DAD|nr:glycosyltransferase [uncultured Polaribacter sp.]
MKVIHIINSIDKSTGGPARSVTHLMEQILKLSKNIHLDLATKNSEKPIIKSFKSKKSNIYFYKNKFKFKEPYDIYHAHGIWQRPIHEMVIEARSEKKPFIITIRGMLEPWSLKQNKLKKYFALQLYQFRDLKKASCLHATAQMEVESLRNLGLKNPIAMIPNGIDLDKFPKEIPVKKIKQKKILFLSRIHPKKGIENLIEAWKELDKSIKKGWVIEIVGNGEPKYIQKLQELIRESKLENQIFILSPVFGSDKIKLYREASLFVLPTFSENFGVVIAEALASYTPVITTKGAPWIDLEKYNCGWWIDIGVKPLRNTLEEAMSISEKTILEKGKNGRMLIEQKYSIDAVARKMITLYNWILKKTEKPAFVDIL